MGAFEHSCDTIQAVNFQSCTLKQEGFRLEIGAKKDDPRVTTVRVSLNNSYGREKDDPMAEGATLEEACRQLVGSKDWCKWVSDRQRDLTNAVSEAEAEREEVLRRHDQRLAILRNLPGYKAQPEDADPKVSGSTWHERVSNSDLPVA